MAVSTNGVNTKSLRADRVTPIKTIFAGTPDFAVPSLHALLSHSSIELVAVYTQPDRRSGRGRKVKLSPIKQAAIEHALPVLQPQSFAEAAAVDQFNALQAELFVVAAYGLILPSTIIDRPRLTTNVHASLLPRWRGAAPIQRAIMAGDKTTGISMMRIVPKLDAGPVLLQESCAIEDHDTAGSLHDKLALLGADCLRRLIDNFANDQLNESEQNENDVTYASKISASDRLLDFSLDAVTIARHVRALNPNPVATLRLSGSNLKVWDAVAVQESTAHHVPGALIRANDLGLDFSTGDGLLRITRLQPEGKRPISAAEFVNGFHHLIADS